MGTRWRKFKYGTEEKNPVWSFYVTIICLGLVLVVCAYAEYSSDFSVWACSFGFGALALASLAHLNLTLDNEKKCAVPIRIMDRKCPDLILLVFLAVLLLRWKSLWRIYYTAVGDILNLLNDAEMVFLGAVLIFLVVLLPIVPAVYFQKFPHYVPSIMSPALEPQAEAFGLCSVCSYIHIFKVCRGVLQLRGQSLSPLSGDDCVFFVPFSYRNVCCQGSGNCFKGNPAYGRGFFYTGNAEAVSVFSVPPGGGGAAFYSEEQKGEHGKTASE